MAVRDFEGGTAGVRCAPGNVDGIIEGASTMVAIAKVAVDGEWVPICEARSAGNARIWYREGGNVLHLETSGGGAGAVSFTASDDWCLVALTKPAGNSTARMHKCVLSTDTWTHTDAGTVGDAAEAVAAINLGWDDRWSEAFVGRIAVIGMWKSALSDGQIEGLRSTLDAWSALSPDGLWPLNQESTTTAVEDITGGGADQTSLVGTSVVTGDDPPGFRFDSAVEGSGVAHGAGFASAATSKLAPGATTTSGSGLGAASSAKVGLAQTVGFGGGSTDALAAKAGGGIGTGHGGGQSQAQVSTLRQTRTVASGSGMGRSAVSRTAATVTTGFGGGYGAHRPPTVIIAVRGPAAVRTTTASSATHSTTASSSTRSTTAEVSVR